MFFALVHRAPPDRGFLPSVSIIISVKNEEAHIAETIERCFRSRYPAHLLEIITVDDGSTDRTWQVLTGLQEKHPNLKIFRFEQNKGKRHAMAKGCEHATGDVYVMVDSDSYLDPEGIYRLVQGFADPRVGAIAGHTRAIVEPDNVISKMESVRYFIAHKMMKTAEGVFGTVTCCPGCFSAYRRSAIMPILPKWLHQTFNGKPATFGDDRSLTNFVLRHYRVLYCDTARCWTYVPNTWAKYFRQQLRWKKSWYRETLTASGIMWRKHPLSALFYYTGILLTFFAPVMVFRNMILLPLVYSMSCVPYVTGIALIYFFFCCVYFYYTRGREWGYGMVFDGLYVGVMCWQNYYAMATVSKTHWGTR
jgi:hyaluronan synthase